MKNLNELMAVVSVTVPDGGVSLTFDEMVSEWNMSPCPQLSVILVNLRFLALVHQTNHWVAKGDAFYGDHLLFSRLYDTVNGEVDSIAEKAVGVGTDRSVDLNLQLSQVQRLAQNFGLSKAQSSMR